MSRPLLEPPSLGSSRATLRPSLTFKSSRYLRAFFIKRQPKAHMTPRFISALLVMQLFIIFLGVSLTGAFLRLHSAGGTPNPSYPQFMRDYGFWLALLPLGWALASAISVRSLDTTPSASSLYCAAGFILLAGLILLFAIAASAAFYVATRMDSEMLPVK